MTEEINVEGSCIKHGEQQKAIVLFGNAYVCPLCYQELLDNPFFKEKITSLSIRKFLDALKETKL